MPYHVNIMKHDDRDKLANAGCNNNINCDLDIPFSTINSIQSRKIKEELNLQKTL